jgi:Zinc finger, C2H2 type
MIKSFLMYFGLILSFSFEVFAYVPDFMGTYRCEAESDSWVLIIEGRDGQMRVVKEFNSRKIILSEIYQNFIRRDENSFTLSGSLGEITMSRKVTLGGKVSLKFQQTFEDGSIEENRDCLLIQKLGTEKVESENLEVSTDGDYPSTSTLSRTQTGKRPRKEKTLGKVKRSRKEETQGDGFYRCGEGVNSWILFLKKENGGVGMAFQYVSGVWRDLLRNNNIDISFVGKNLLLSIEQEPSADDEWSIQRWNCSYYDDANSLVGAMSTDYKLRNLSEEAGKLPKLPVPKLPVIDTEKDDIQPSKQLIKCDICGKSYRSSPFGRHMREEHSDSELYKSFPFGCRCGKRFKRAGGLARHIKVGNAKGDGFHAHATE